MRYFKRFLIWLLDRFDHLILQHRHYRFCDWIAHHPWWNWGWVRQEPFQVLTRFYWIYMAQYNFKNDEPLLQLRLKIRPQPDGTVLRTPMQVITVGEMKAMLRTFPNEWDDDSSIDPEVSFRQAWHEVQTGQTKPIAELWDDLAEQEFLDYLEHIGAIREDDTIDRSKIKHHLDQTFEELEALLRKRRR